MRRLVGWIGGAVGGIAAYRLLRRRSQLAPEPSPSESDQRAEELRAKLAETRVAEPLAEDAVAGEEPQSALESESPDDRRRRVHEEGRATLDEMKSDGVDG